MPTLPRFLFLFQVLRVAIREKSFVNWHRFQNNFTTRESGVLETLLSSVAEEIRGHARLEVMLSHLPIKAMDDNYSQGHIVGFPFCTLPG